MKRLLLAGAGHAHLGVLRGDERLIQRCLGNVLSNAIRFTPRAGRVEVHGEVLRQGDQQGQAVIQVKDTGIGIDPKDHERVFEAFVRNTQPRSEIASEGAGIGLALVRGFVQLHGGQTRLTSRPGEGSTFTIVFTEQAPQASGTAAGGAVAPELEECQ